VIDVLLPFYGDPQQLREAVNSVLAQTSPHWRLIVVDDCFPGERVQSWLEGLDDPRVVYRRNARNLGVNRNFQHCLELAEAEHVTFLGGDDVMLPRYVELVSAAAETSGAAMVQPRVRVIDHDGRSVGTLTDRVKSVLLPRGEGDRTMGGERLAARLLTGNWAYFPAICWRRDLALSHGFRPGLDLVLDLRLILDLVADGHEFLLLEEELFAYRRHRDSASSQAALNTARFTEERAFFTEAAEEFRAMGWPRAARAARLHATSRLHAAALVPGAVRQRDRGAVNALMRHVCR